MPELRLALIAVAVLLVVAVYLFSRWQGKQGDTGTRPRHHRPRVDEDDLPSISVSRPARRPEPPVESKADARLAGLKQKISSGFASLAASVSSDEERDGDMPPEADGEELSATRPPAEHSSRASEEEDPAAEALKGFDPDSQKIISLHVLAVGETGLDGGELRTLLEDNGCLHGQYGIFHRSERDGAGRPSLLFSVANIVEPGQFDLDRMGGERYRGVTLFAVLPGPWSGLAAFHEMVSLARRLAEALGGDVRDEARNAFSRQRETHIQEQITEFERLRRQRLERRGS